MKPFAEQCFVYTLIAVTCVTVTWFARRTRAITKEAAGAIVPIMAMPSGGLAHYAAGPPPTGSFLVAPVASPPAFQRALLFRVTAYCPCEICCGKWADGVTASGLPVTANGSKFCAAPQEIPFGTMLDIPGYGRVPVLDRGGAIAGNRIDVFYETHAEAKRWGVQWLTVKGI